MNIISHLRSWLPSPGLADELHLRPLHRAHDRLRGGGVVLAVAVVRVVLAVEVVLVSAAFADLSSKKTKSKTFSKNTDLLNKILDLKFGSLKSCPFSARVSFPKEGCFCHGSPRHFLGSSRPFPAPLTLALMTGSSGGTRTVRTAYLDLMGATPGAAPTWHWKRASSSSETGLMSRV